MTTTDATRQSGRRSGAPTVRSSGHAATRAGLAALPAPRVPGRLPPRRSVSHSMAPCSSLRLCPPDGGGCFSEDVSSFCVSVHILTVPGARGRRGPAPPPPTLVPALHPPLNFPGTKISSAIEVQVPSGLPRPLVCCHGDLQAIWLGGCLSVCLSGKGRWPVPVATLTSSRVFSGLWAGGRSENTPGLGRSLGTASGTILHLEGRCAGGSGQPAGPLAGGQGAL